MSINRYSPLTLEIVWVVVKIYLIEYFCFLFLNVAFRLEGFQPWLHDTFFCGSFIIESMTEPCNETMSQSRFAKIASNLTQIY